MVTPGAIRYISAWDGKPLRLTEQRRKRNPVASASHPSAREEAMQRVCKFGKFIDCEMTGGCDVRRMESRAYVECSHALRLRLDAADGSYDWNSRGQLREQGELSGMLVLVHFVCEESSLMRCERNDEAIEGQSIWGD